MKKQEYTQELQGMDLEQLEERLRTLGEEEMKLRFRQANGQLDRPHLLGEVRKNIARVLTRRTQVKSGNEEVGSAVG